MDKTKENALAGNSRNGKIRIKIIGVGGAGGNAVDYMAGALLEPSTPAESADTPQRSARKNLCLTAVNTDAQALELSQAPEKLQIGANVTHGLGAGGDPMVGRAAAEDSVQELRAMVKGADIVVVTAGLGGGTGSGASSVIARLAREQGAVVLGLVSLPFEFEGERRRQQALEGVEALRGEADAVIAVPNDKLFKMVDGRASVPEAFRQANNILVQVVRAIDRLLSRTGLINLDFADLKAVLKKPHTQTLFGFGEGQSEKKLSQAVAGIFASPLLENGKLIEGADEMLVSIVGGPDLTYADVQETMSQLSRHASERTHIMVGAAIDEAFTGKLSITVIASTGHAQAAARGRMTVGATGGVSEASRTSPRSHVKDTKSVGGLKEKPVSPEKQADKVEGETVPVATCTSSTEQVSAEATSTDGRVIRIDAGETGTIGTPIPIERTPAQKARPVTNAAVPPVRVGHAHAVANLGASGSNAAVKPAQTNAEQNPAKPRQTALPLELEAKGCFGRGEPNLHEGEDLDIPTFLRRGIRV